MRGCHFFSSKARQTIRGRAVKLHNSVLYCLRQQIDLSGRIVCRPECIPYLPITQLSKQISKPSRLSNRNVFEFTVILTLERDLYPPILDAFDKLIGSKVVFRLISRSSDPAEQGEAANTHFSACGTEIADDIETFPVALEDDVVGIFHVPVVDESHHQFEPLELLGTDE